MRDIVAQALEAAAEARDDAEDGDDDRDPEAFGPPQFALVGCGEAGIDRANVGVREAADGRYSDDSGVTAVAVGAPSSLDSDRSDVCVPVEPDDRSAVESSDLRGDGRTDLESRLDAVDVAVVTAHLSDPETAELTAAAADCLPADATVVAVVSVPESPPDSDRFSAGFERVAGAADTVVPLDFARLRSGFDAFADSPDADDSPVRSLADGLVRELATDCFEVIREPLAAPVDLVRLYDLLDTGGIALAYRGVGTRDDVAAELLDHAVAHRLCDGDRSTADGGIGVCRFGEPFTLSEYQHLFEAAADRFGTAAAERDRWVHAGNATTGLGEKCRVTILLTGVEPSSLRFFDHDSG